MNPITTQSLRNDFLLEPQVIYLNHGSFGATPAPVFERYQYWQRELERQPTEFIGRRANQLLEQSRQVLADYLGTHSNQLAYVTNATAGLNIVARSLPLKAGDEVLSTNHEYGALDRTWQYLAKLNGFKYINQPIPVPVSTQEAFLEDLWAGVTPRTRVIFLSQITSPTALIFPVQEVCRRAREQGILTVIDGAHVPGQIPLNLDELGADFYSGNLHKWLCAPKGAAFLYTRPEVMNLIEPLIVSWGYQSDNTGSNRLVDFVEMQGTRDLSAFLSVPDAIAFQKSHDWNTVRESCHQLAAQTVREIASLSGQPPLSPLTQEWFGQMASAPLPEQVNPLDIHNQLYETFHIEIPVLEWNGHKLVRCSFQAYNTPEDAQALILGLKQLLSIH